MRPAVCLSRLSFAMFLILTACTTGADVDTNHMLINARATSQQALARREAVAAQPRYRATAARLTLVDPDRATLAQMAACGIAVNSAPFGVQEQPAPNLGGDL